MRRRSQRMRTGICAVCGETLDSRVRWMLVLTQCLVPNRSCGDEPLILQPVHPRLAKSVVTILPWIGAKDVEHLARVYRRRRRAGSLTVAWRGWCRRNVLTSADRLQQVVLAVTVHPGSSSGLMRTWHKTIRLYILSVTDITGGLTYANYYKTTKMIIQYLYKLFGQS